MSALNKRQQKTFSHNPIQIALLCLGAMISQNFSDSDVNIVFYFFFFFVKYFFFHSVCASETHWTIKTSDCPSTIYALPIGIPYTVHMSVISAFETKEYSVIYKEKKYSHLRVTAITFYSSRWIDRAVFNKFCVIRLGFLTFYLHFYSCECQQH